MKYFKVLYGCAALLCLVSSGAIARTALQHRDGSYLAGKIAGRVETIFNNLSLDIHKKRLLLRQELGHAEQLQLHALAQKINAMIALLVVQGKSLEPYVTQTTESDAKVPASESDIFDTPESLVTATLDGDTDAPSAADDASAPASGMSVEDITAFGTEVIERAAAYSDRLTIMGTPSVSHHRMATLGLFIRRIKSQTDAFARAQESVTVCKKIYDLLAENKTLQKFVDGFKKHIQKKYDAVTTDIEGNIKFKVFEILAYLSSDENQTAEEVVGDFLSSYNSYVVAPNTITADELNFPVQEWAHMILTTDQVVKHIMLVLSFAMEQVKHDIRREPLAQQLYDDVQAQVAQSLTLLEEDGVAVSDAERANPLELAQKCSHQVQALLSAEGASFSSEQQARVEQYVNVVDQISQLTSDYDMVVREMADTAALNRLANDISQLPESEQQILKDASAIDPAVLQEIVPAFGEDQEFEEESVASGRAPRKRRSRMSTGAKVGMGIGISAAILFVLWQATGMAIKAQASKAGSAGDGTVKQPFAFWDLLTAAGTPIGLIANIFRD